MVSLLDMAYDTFCERVTLHEVHQAYGSPLL